MENLYGKGIEAETRVVGLALRAAATRETTHPDNRGLWTPDNPTYGQCCLFTDYCRKIWGRDIAGITPRWNQESKILVWWVYKNYETFKAGPRKNKIDVHYSFRVSPYGEIDLSRDQFPNGTYLLPRPRPLRHELAVNRSWPKSMEMGKRRELFEPRFADALLHLPLPETITPGLEFYIDELRRREKR